MGLQGWGGWGREPGASPAGAGEEGRQGHPGWSHGDARGAHTAWGGGRIRDRRVSRGAGRSRGDGGRGGHEGGAGRGAAVCRSEGRGGGWLTEGGVGAQLAVVALVAFARAPAVVAAALHQVHLLELVLAHVSAEEAPAARAGRRVPAVEGAAPHVAHAQGVDLGPRGGVAHERVVARDAVERAALVVVHVDAQHLAQQRRPAGGGQGGQGGWRRRSRCPAGSRSAWAVGPDALVQVLPSCSPAGYPHSCMHSFIHSFIQHLPGTSLCTRLQRHWTYTPSIAPPHPRHQPFRCSGRYCDALLQLGQRSSGRSRNVPSCHTASKGRGLGSSPGSGTTESQAPSPNTLSNLPNACLPAVIVRVLPLLPASLSGCPRE